MYAEGLKTTTKNKAKKFYPDLAIIPWEIGPVIPSD